MTVNGTVARGRDGQLFLAGGPHEVQAYLEGTKSPSEESVERFHENIAQRAAYCGSRAIPYLHCIFPDKASALRDETPFDVTTSYVDHYREDLHPRVLEFDLRDRTECYLKKDTHLSFEGRLETSKHLITRMLSLGVEDVLDRLETRRGPLEPRSGDLGRKLTPPEEEQDHHAISRPAYFLNNRAGANDGVVYIGINPELIRQGEMRRLLIFGDSFMEFNLPFLATCFSEILFCRTRFFHSEMVEMYCPDYLVTENAERYLATVTPDSQAPRFMNAYGLRDIQPPKSQTFFKAYDALLNFGNPAYNSFVGSIVDGRMGDAR